MKLVFLFLLGLIVGSFLGVCIDRIPNNRSIVFPGSHCDHCGQKLHAIDLIPILSYIFLKGKCRYCGHKIDKSMLMIEIVTAVCFCLLGAHIVDARYLIPSLVMIAILIVISFIDYFHLIIPDSILIISIFLIGISNLIFQYRDWLNMLLGSLIAFLLFLLLAMLIKDGMGGGDIKLIGVLGLYLGWQKILLVIFLASLVGLIFYLIFKIRGNERIQMPFAPSISIASFIVMLYGNELIFFYLNTWMR
jgi:prepilin signal peptidase PulO-like enzyme (type II secretory pathway)